MKEDEIQHLFQLAKEEPSEVAVEEVTNWINIAAAATSTVTLFSILKYKYLFFTKKGIIMIGTFFATVGMGTALFISTGFGNKTSHDEVSTKQIVPVYYKKPIPSVQDYEKDQVKSNTDSTLGDKNATHSPVVTVQSDTIIRNTEQDEKQQEDKNKLVHIPEKVIVIPDSPKSSQPIDKNNAVATQLENADRNSQSGEQVRADFTKIKVSGVYKLVLIQGDHSSYRLEGDQKSLEKVNITVRNGTIIFGIKSNTNHFEVTAYVTIKDLVSINSSGAVDIKSENQLEQDQFHLDLSGASNLKLSINAKNIYIESSGASEIKLNGKCYFLKVESSGASELNALSLDAAIVEISDSGASEVKVSVKDELKCTVSGAGEVYYKGNPQKVSEKVSGAAEIKKL